MAAELILIVDDTPVNLKLTRILLANQGYRVLTASSAEEALELLRTNHPLLVLTDVQLPGMDGLELARRIKSGPETREVIVVALAAFSNSGEEEEALKAGCEGCIAKPVDTQMLAVRVREFLHRREDPPAAAPAGTSSLQQDPTLQPLRGPFLAEAGALVRGWKAGLAGEFDPEPAAQAAHQWIGAAGLLGYPALSEKARALEMALRARPIDTAELRDALNDLLSALGDCEPEA